MCYHWNRCKASNRWRRQARIRTPPYTHKNRQIRVADLLYQMAHGNILLCISLCLIYNNYYGKENQPEYKWRPRPYNVLSNVYVDHNLYYLSSSQLYIYIGLIACAYKIVVYLPNIMVPAFSINLEKKTVYFLILCSGMYFEAVLWDKSYTVNHLLYYYRRSLSFQQTRDMANIG